MHRRALVLTLMLAMPSAATSQSNTECACATYPFRPNPPCYEICAVKTISLVPVDEWSDVLDLPPSLKTKINELQRSPEFAYPYTHFFSPEQQVEIIDSFDKASPEALEQLLRENFGE